MVRLEALRTKLPGIPMTGVYEPSSALMDVCFQQSFHEVLLYVPWQDCTSRQQEVLLMRKDVGLQKGFKVDRDNNVKAV
eukprot:6481969-Amphidinium_carterae.1